MDKQNIKKLTTASLADAMKSMRVGEVAQAPDGYTILNVRREASSLKKEGYRFATSTKAGYIAISRLQ